MLGLLGDYYRKRTYLPCAEKPDTCRHSQTYAHTAVLITAFSYLPTQDTQSTPITPSRDRGVWPLQAQDIMVTHHYPPLPPYSKPLISQHFPDAIGLSTNPLINFLWGGVSLLFLLVLNTPRAISPVLTSPFLCCLITAPDLIGC